jgi:hypothetical protein
MDDHPPCVVTTNAVVSQPAITVILFVFNHAKFLDKALASIEMQTTTEAMEIIIHDDASTDDSRVVYERFQTASRHSVTVVRQVLNKVSRKVSFWPEVIARCRGELITIGDGDDFWTTPIKLQNQYVALGALPHVDLCFHRVTKVDHATEAPTGMLGDYGDDPRLFSAATVIEGDGGFMPTISLMFRRSVLTDLPAWFFRPPPIEDYFVQVQGSLRGGALYLPMPAAAYREGDPQAWTQRVTADPQLKITFEGRLITSLLDLADTLPEPLLPNLEKVLMRYFFQLCHGAITHNQYPAVWAAIGKLQARRERFTRGNEVVSLPSNSNPTSNGM